MAASPQEGPTEQRAARVPHAPGQRSPPRQTQPLPASCLPADDLGTPSPPGPASPENRDPPAGRSAVPSATPAPLGEGGRERVRAAGPTEHPDQVSAQRTWDFPKRAWPSTCFGRGPQQVRLGGVVARPEGRRMRKLAWKRASPRGHGLSPAGTWEGSPSTGTPSTHRGLGAAPGE